MRETAVILRIDHVSLAVRDYETAKSFFEKAFGAVSGAAMEDSALGYLWHMFTLGDMSRLELITPVGEKSFLKNFLKTRDGGVHHITLETDDIREVMRQLEENNIPYFGFNENEIWSELFIHPKDAFGALIQIEQPGQDYHLVEPVKRPEGKRVKVKPLEDGCELRIHHPGGVELKLKLNKEEMRDLAKELQQGLEAP
jgi:methylmalonyl-CoA/ethylmalonyl-CoA epimerase